MYIIIIIIIKYSFAYLRSMDVRVESTAIKIAWHSMPLGILCIGAAEQQQKDIQSIYRLFTKWVRKTVVD